MKTILENIQENYDNVVDDRVRYGRLNKNKAPKNTLFTYSRDNETIYFGIARYNVKADRFIKRIGKYIAEERAMKAEWDDNHGEYSSCGAILLHNSGLRGKVKKSNVKDLLDYFKTVDKRFVNKSNP